MILKVDLSKYFNHASWLYIRKLLTHLGFPIEFIQWMMCSITNITFSVLMNGLTSPFFHAERGLMQGYPLSPLLFLLIMEGNNRLILEEHRMGRLHGITNTNSYILTNILSVHYVLMFLNGGSMHITDL